MFFLFFCGLCLCAEENFQKRVQISLIASEAVCDTARGAIGGKQKNPIKFRITMRNFPYYNKRKKSRNIL